MIYISILWCRIKSIRSVCFFQSASVDVCICITAHKFYDQKSELDEAHRMVDFRNVIDYIANACIEYARLCVLLYLDTGNGMAWPLHDDYDVCVHCTLCTRCFVCSIFSIDRQSRQSFHKIYPHIIIIARTDGWVPINHSEIWLLHFTHTLKKRTDIRHASKQTNGWMNKSNKASTQNKNAHTHTRAAMCSVHPPARVRSRTYASTLAR